MHRDAYLFENVQAATEWTQSYGVGDLFRGQANADWDLIPSIERPAQLSISEREQETSRFIDALLKSFPRYNSLPEIELFAIAQHYGFSTHLLDYTTDPRVAAFFAAPGGLTLGKYGEIHMVVRTDLESFQNPLLPLGASSRESERLMKRHKDFVGRMAVVEVKGIPRIERQQARFIWDASPGALRRNFLDRYYFVQHPSLGYADKEGVITVDYLFPKDDPIQQFVQSHRGHPR